MNKKVKENKLDFICILQNTLIYLTLINGRHLDLKQAEQAKKKLPYELIK